MKAKILALFLLATPALALAQWWDPNFAMIPEKYRRPVEYTPWLVLHAQAVITEAVAAGDFGKLDRMHDEFLEMHRTNAPGKDLISAFFPGMNRAFGNKARHASTGALFIAWRKGAPDSRLRPTAEAAYHVQIAWDARGEGYASSVTPEGWKTFRDELAKAAQILDEGQAKGKESPLWYESVLAVGGAMGAPGKALDQVLDEGSRKFPAFASMYATRLNYLLPQWGGDYPGVDRFIRAAVMRSQATEGTTFYARLYRDVVESYKGEDFFRDTPASWRLMKHAFEEEAARGIVDLNEYATFACMARDRETTARLLVQLGDKANLGANIQGFSTEVCAELVREAR